MSIYITGDCHGNFRKLGKRHVPAKENDYVIICGDVGLLWESRCLEEISHGDIRLTDECCTFDYNLKWLSNIKYTLLWIPGNHDNYDMIAEYPIETWHGGKARHIIRDKVICLERGQIFTIEDKTFFTFGGASSHDITEGILNPADFNTEADYKAELKYWKKTKKD